MKKLFKKIFEVLNIKNEISYQSNIINSLSHKLFNLEGNIEEIKINQARLLSDFNMNFKQEIIKKNIQNSEFKVFSQWGDDGIINFLVNYLDIEDKRFIEFGVENYTECNTKLLLMMYNWKGLIMDGSLSNIEYIKNSNLNWKHDITLVNSFITAENINDLINKNNFTGNIGLLHIDIDGNDYWIWKAINNVNPIIVIIEYNGVFGNDRALTVPYKANFFRTEAHYSNLYFGASLQSLCDLAESKGYSFIGSNSNGNNAYFIRKDKIKDLKVLSCKEGFVKSLFRESLNEKGELSYISGDDRLSKIKGNLVFNTRTNSIENL